MTSSGPWWIAHTKSRCEKRFAWELVRRGVDYFLPMFPRDFISGGRKRHGMYVLFPGYVFFRGDDHARVDALSTQCLVQVLTVPDQARLPLELSQIERALASGLRLSPLDRLEVGRRCRVVAGSLQGIEGTVLQRRDGVRLLLGVHLIGRGTEVEIDANLLELID